MQTPTNGEKKQPGLSWSNSAQGQAQQQAPAAKPTNAPSPAPANKALVMPQPTKSPAARYAALLVGGVIVGVLIAWSAGAWRKDAASNTTLNGNNQAADQGTTSALDANSAAMPAQGSTASFSIVSPQAPGTSVAISKAVVAEPTWVVVYEDQAGKPGNALGAGLFFPGQPSGTVELLRATVSGKSYLAVEQTDNGDRKFSLKDDKMVSVGGAVQWVNFMVK